MDDPAVVPPTPPPSMLEEPFLVPPRPMETPPVPPLSTESEKPPKKNKPLLIGGLVLFILAGTILSYFALQKGPVWLRMGAQQVYPPTLTPIPPTPPACAAQKSYSGSSGCSQAGSARVSMTACVPAGCPATTVDYHEVNITCTGESYATCDSVCGNSGTNKTLSVPAGGCNSVAVSCSSPQCGSCQVDLDGYGAKSWQNSGCGSTPSPTPAVPPVSAACVSVAVEIAVPGKDINSLRAGDTISFKVSFLGAVGDVAVDLRKGGVSVKSFYAGGPKTTTWTTPSYTVGSAGSYEVMAFIKINGVWK